MINSKNMFIDSIKVQVKVKKKGVEVVEAIYVLLH